MPRPRAFIAVGHGGRPDGTFDPGASDGTWSEQTAGDIVVKAMADELRKYPVDVNHEAHQDDPNFRGSTHAANAWNADLTVAVHHDWIRAPDGWFAFWYPGSDHGERAARMLRAAVDEAGFELRDDWFRPRSNLYVLNQTDHPAVLVECGRIGQYAASELKQLGRAMAGGVAAYFGVTQPQPEEEDDMPTHVNAVVYEYNPDAKTDVDEGMAHVLAAHVSYVVGQPVPVLRHPHEGQTVGHAWLVGLAGRRAPEYPSAKVIRGNSRQDSGAKVARAVGAIP